MSIKTEITPAMVGAGIDAWKKEIESGVLRCDSIQTWEYDAMGVTVREIFTSMLAARKENQIK